MSGQYNVISCPATVIIDGNKNIVYYHINYNPGYENDLNEVIEGICQGKIPNPLDAIPITIQLETENTPIRMNVNEARDALECMHTDYDDFEEITWYNCNNGPRYINVNRLEIYVGKKKGQYPWLRFRFQYTADDWLFVDSLVFKIDDRRYELYIGSNNVKREVGQGWIAEVYDVTPTGSLLEIVNAIADASNAKMRIQGTTYSKDKTITKSQISNFAKVLNAYEALIVLHEAGEI